MDDLEIKSFSTFPEVKFDFRYSIVCGCVGAVKVSVWQKLKEFLSKGF